MASSRPSLPRKPSDSNRRDHENPSNLNGSGGFCHSQSPPQDAFYNPNPQSPAYTSADSYRYGSNSQTTSSSQSSSPHWSSPQPEASIPRPRMQSNHSFDHTSSPNHTSNYNDSVSSYIVLEGQQMRGLLVRRTLVLRLVGRTAYHPLPHFSFPTLKLSPNLRSEQQRPVSLGGIISMYANSDDIYEPGSDSNPTNESNNYYSSSSNSYHNPAAFPQPQISHNSQNRSPHISPPSNIYSNQHSGSTASHRLSRPLPPPPTAPQATSSSPPPSSSYYQSPYQFASDQIQASSSNTSNLSSNSASTTTFANDSGRDHFRTPESSTFSNSNGAGGASQLNGSGIRNGYESGHKPQQSSVGSFGLPGTPSQGAGTSSSGRANAPAWSPALSSASLPGGAHSSSKTQASPSAFRLANDLTEAPERTGNWNENQSEVLGDSPARPVYGRTTSSSSFNKRRPEGSAHLNEQSASASPNSHSNRPPIPVIIPPQSSRPQAGPLSPRAQQFGANQSGDDGYNYSTPPSSRAEWNRDPSPRPQDPPSGSLSRQSSRGGADGVERDQHGYPIDRKTPRYVDVHARTDSTGNQSGGLLSPTMSPVTRTFSGNSNQNFNPISRIPPAPSRNQQHRQSNGNPVEYVDFSLLSNLAVLLRDAVPRGEQIKGSIAYPGAFTGRDVVSTLQGLIPKELAADSMGIGNDLRNGNFKNWEDGIGSEQNNRSRRVALLVAKTLKKQLFFHEVDWGEGELNDGVEDVYMFLGDTLGEGDEISNRRNQNSFNSFEPSTSSSNSQRKSLKQTSDPFSDDWTSPLEASGPLDLGLLLPSHSNNQNSASDLDELPTGIFTPLTSCYSPLCGKPNSPLGTECYSSSCPRSKSSPLKRHISSASTSAASPFDTNSLSASNSFNSSMGASGSGFGTAPTTPNGNSENRVNARAWVETVPKELLNSLSQKEIDRQNAIHETIQKEEEFLADVELLEELFIKGLERPNEQGDPPPIPIGPARDAFIAEVFSNHRVLAFHIRNLVERLHIRQREEHPIIQAVGDIFLDAALEWTEVYQSNLVNFPLAKSRVRREMQINPRFKEFIETCRRHPLAHRHELDSFLYRPTARLQRYHLHFEAIIKKTEATNEDRASLTQAMEIIDAQCKDAQIGVASTETKVKIRDIAWGLANKRNKATIDMDLLHPERQLVHQGRVLRKPDFTDFEWTDLQAVLFDNYLIVVKPKKVEQGDITSPRYILAKRPIPVEMIELSGFNDASVSRSIGLSNFHIRERDTRDLWPFTVQHIGGKMEPLTLFSVSKEGREEWKKKLDEAMGLRSAVQDANKVFESHVLSDNIFAVPSASSIDPDRPPQGVDSSVFHGKVTCAVPFATADGRRLVAIGCSDGVWIGLRNDPRSLRKVLHLKLVSQCAVLEPFGIFVVLADKVLISYSLEALVPSSGGGASQSSPRPPQKLSGNRDVVFFSVGVLKERTLLVYMKRRANECVFRALEPVMNAPRADQGRSGGGLFGRFGKDTKNPDWFRIYKTFFIPSEAYTMQFLRSKLCIVCARGFEIMNLDSLLPGTIPDFSHCPRDDPRIQAIAKRVETAKPLGMFKSSESEFLLCYNDFACYVDRVGEPIRLDNIIEWEGTPQSVTFQAPYVLAFDSRFVEVRDSATGRLVQIIRGSDMRYVSGSSTVSSNGVFRQDGESVYSPEGVQDQTIIITQRRRANGRNPYDYQSVVELVSNVPTQIIAPTLSHSNTMSSRAGWI